MFCKCSWQRFEARTIRCRRRLFTGREAEWKYTFQPWSDVTENLLWGVVQERQPHRQIVLCGKLPPSSSDGNRQSIHNSWPLSSWQVWTDPNPERRWSEWHKPPGECCASSVVLATDTHQTRHTRQRNRHPCRYALVTARARKWQQQQLLGVTV